MIKAKENHDLLAKLIIIGDSGVGKTNIILRFVGEEFKDSYVATIGVDFKAKTIQVDDKRVKLQIWDTAGQQRYRTITQTYYKGASGIILAYSIDDRTSFQNLEKWMSQINQKAPPGVPKILLGNKVDLSETSRLVRREEGEALAKKFSNGNDVVQFEQVSAKTGAKVNQSVYMIARRVKKVLQNQMQTVARSLFQVVVETEVQKSQTKKICRC